MVEGLSSIFEAAEENSANSMMEKWAELREIWATISTYMRIQWNSGKQRGRDKTKYFKIVRMPQISKAVLINIAKKLYK